MLANLLRENSGRMSLGKGLKDFARANGLNMGKRNSYSFKNSRLGLPLPFMRENGMNEPGTIALLGKDVHKFVYMILFITF
ncbi:hypothetical protein Bca4012_078733 [Brassica carinata]